MTLNELRTNLTLMGWQQHKNVPLYWEQWGHNFDHLFVRMEPSKGLVEVGRFAQDGNSAFSVDSYQGLFQLAEDADNEFERVQSEHAPDGVDV